MSFRKRAAIGALLFLLVLGALGLGVGLAIKPKTSFQTIGPSKLINVGENEYINIEKISINQGNFISKGVNT
jgi:hypothetical protein